LKNQILFHHQQIEVKKAASKRVAKFRENLERAKELEKHQQVQQAAEVSKYFTDYIGEYILFVLVDSTLSTARVTSGGSLKSCSCEL